MFFEKKNNLNGSIVDLPQSITQNIHKTLFEEKRTYLWQEIECAGDTVNLTSAVDVNKQSFCQPKRLRKTKFVFFTKEKYPSELIRKERLLQNHQHRYELSKVAVFHNRK